MGNFRFQVDGLSLMLRLAPNRVLVDHCVNPAWLIVQVRQDCGAPPGHRGGGNGASTTACIAASIPARSTATAPVFLETIPTPPLSLASGSRPGRQGLRSGRIILWRNENDSSSLPRINRDLVLMRSGGLAEGAAAHRSLVGPQSAAPTIHAFSRC